MANIDLLKKICAMECSFEELEKFNIEIDNIEFDNIDSFSKYYDLSLIISAIEKYKNGGVNDLYLSHWANTYNWIIMASNWNNKSNFEFKTLIQNQISYILDSLSFFNEREKDFYDLDSYIDSFKFYDSILNDSSDYKVYFREYGGKFHNKNEVYVVAVNDIKMNYIKFSREYLRESGSLLATKLTIQEIAKLVKDLNAKNYKELK